MASVLDLHVHTNQGSPDSSLTPDELVAEALRVGLSGVMVTEHVGWPRPEFEAFAREQGMLLVRALENYSPLGHIITLGLDSHVTGFTGGIDTVKKLRQEVDKVGGFMILAHPFRYLFELPGIYSQNLLFEDPQALPSSHQEAAEHPIFRLVHDVEVVNGANNEVENRFAQGVAGFLEMPGTGGSDAHSVNGLGKGSTLFPGDIRNERDLLDALRAGEYVPQEGFHLGSPRSYRTGT